MSILLIIFFGNPSVKKSRKGSGGSSVKTLKRNLYPLNCIGSFHKNTIQTAGRPICMTSMIALQGFGGRTSRPYRVKYHPITERLPFLWERALKNQYMLSRLHTCLPQAGISKDDYADSQEISGLF
jgi:hypothetical protein